MNKIRKVLYADSSPVFSGAEFSLLQLLRALDRRRFAPLLCFNYPRPHQEQFRTAETPFFFRAEGLKWWMGSDRWKRPVRGSDCTKRIIFAMRLASRLRTSKADLFHLNLTWTNSYWDLFAAKRVGTRTVAHVRSFLPDFQLPRSVLQNADAVICVSNVVRNVVLQASPHQRVFTVYDPIDTSAYASITPRSAACDNLKLPSGRRYICSIGLLNPIKGHDTAICAFAQLAGEFPGLDLVIVGGAPNGEVNGAEFTRLNTLAKSFGLQDRVHFTDEHVRNIQDAYAVAEIVYALTKCGEAFGRVPLEAAASRVPAIVVNQGAAPEIVVNGKTGILVPADDSAAVACESRKLLKGITDRNALCETAFQHVLTNFSAETHARGIEGVYASLLNETSK